MIGTLQPLLMEKQLQQCNLFHSKLWLRRRRWRLLLLLLLMLLLLLLLLLRLLGLLRSIVRRIPRLRLDRVLLKEGERSSQGGLEGEISIGIGGR